MTGPFEASALEMFECNDENILVSATTENGERVSPNGMFLYQLRIQRISKMY